MNLNRKRNRLKQLIEEMSSVLVAFSGGVDSTLLLKIAHDVLGGKVLAVTALSDTYPKREEKAARAAARGIGAQHRLIRTDELENADFSENPPNRCYFCKRELFSRLGEIARSEGYRFVVEASNRDDEKDFRPGFKAIEELKVRSPLREAGFTKQDIRELSRQLKLPVFDKPSSACLASRFPYGQSIDRNKLRMVEQAEAYLYKLNFKQCRVRHHGTIARIEVEAGDLKRFADQALRDRVHKHLRRLGFTYVTLDLAGYRQGSMNENIGVTS